MEFKFRKKFQYIELDDDLADFNYNFINTNIFEVNENIKKLIPDNLEKGCNGNKRNDRQKSKYYLKIILNNFLT